MKIGIIQMNPIVGDISGNISKIMQAAKSMTEADLIVAPELSIIGYPPRDLLNRSDFVEANVKAATALVEFTKSIPSALAFGFAIPRVMDGKSNYNAVLVAKNGEILTQRAKTLLPTYDVFEEAIYFEPGDSTSPLNFEVVEIAGTKVGFVICEEAWNDRDFWAKRLYNHDPVETMCKNGAEYIVSLNASPYRQGVLETRHKMVAEHCRSNNVGFAYINMVGYNDDVGFDGNSFLMNRNGDIVFHAIGFDEHFEIANTEAAPLPSHIIGEESWEEEVVKALILGIRDYFGKLNIQGPAIIGLSGGIDSALVAYLASQALPAIRPKSSRVIGIGMPSEFSSEGSVYDANTIARTLGIRFAVEPIRTQHDAMRVAVDDINEQLYSPLGTYAECKESGVTDENLQARIRGAYLMAIANFHNGIVLSTGNKSEMAVGYCTLYGDMCGGLAVISDVCKTDVYSICRWINKNHRQEIIPWATINKKPSAELRADQHDQQSLPPYELLDATMKLYVEDYRSPEQIIQELVTEEKAIAYLRDHNRMMDADIIKVCKLIRNNQFKRVQSPTGLKVTSKLFKMGYRMPIVHRWS